MRHTEIIEFLIQELKMSIHQMELAGECIEKGRYDEALLHVNSLHRQKHQIIDDAEKEIGIK